MKRLLRPSIGVQEKCSYLKTESSLKPILGTEELTSNRWNNKFSIKIPNSRLVCIRGFSSCMNRPKNMLIVDKTLDRITEESKRHFSKHLIMTECKQLFLKKSSAPKSLRYTMVAASPSCLPSIKSCLPIETYISTSLPCYYETINLKCRNMLSSPCSPPYPVVHSKFMKKSQSQKIYNKCPLLLKNLKSPLPSSFKYSKLNSLELGKNKETDSLTYRDPSFLTPLHSIHRRRYHISSFCLADSNSDKPFGCKSVDEICQSPELKKTEQSNQSCNERPDCYPKKNKCDKRQQAKENKEVKSNPETEQKIKDRICKKDCLARGKCEWPHTVPPPKMEYVKVTCPPPKFLRPNPCPSTSEHIKKSDAPPIETKKAKTQKAQICSPPPLPKPPYGPITLCPCPPPSKIHPGACPCYEKRVIPKPTLMPPCPLKKPYPCPNDIHYCSVKKKPCNLFEDNQCEQKRKKKTTKTSVLSNK